MRNEVKFGHVIDLAKTIPDNCIDCIVTSPPYYGQRSYGGREIVWGGKKDCQHEWGEVLKGFHPGQIKRSNCDDSGASEKGGSIGSGRNCLKCNAWIGELGQEPTPDEFVAHLVCVFREMRRILKPTGTLYLNLGDSFVSSGSGVIDRDDKYKPKDMIGIPWRVALALHADGWYLRQDIIWNRPKVIPERVDDRFVRCHEFIFMLTKTGDYYFDREAVREPSQLKTADFEAGPRMRRDVWTINPQIYKGAHFAVYPPELPEICVLASTSERGCCPTCGKPWDRLIYRKEPILEVRSGKNMSVWKANNPDMTICWTPSCECYGIKIVGKQPKSDIDDWLKECGRLKPIYDMLPVVKSLVLDPFAGSGTTLLVAKRNGRDYLGFDIQVENGKLIEDRLKE